MHLCWQHLCVSWDLLFGYQARFSMPCRCQKHTLFIHAIFLIISTIFQHHDIRMYPYQHTKFERSRQAHGLKKEIIENNSFLFSSFISHSQSQIGVEIGKLESIDGRFHLLNRHACILVWVGWKEVQYGRSQDHQKICYPHQSLSKKAVFSLETR